MVTRRTDARRRRVLSEEFVPTDQNAVEGNRKPMQAYSYGANRRNQPKTTDMIPKRAVSLGMFFLLIATVATALNLLAWYAAPIAEVLGEPGSETFALSGVGTLANWICCLSLFLCSGICVQLFYLRRHKRDDYGGMYYVWFVMAVMFFVASIDCAIDLRTVFAKLFEAATQRSLLQTPWLMMAIELIVLAVIVIRMLFEVRASRFSLAAVLLVWLGFVGCVVLSNSDVATSIEWLDQKVAYGNCVLLGCVGSLVALVVYTRFVFLHAHGLIQLKVAMPQESTDEQPVKTTVKKSTRTKKKADPAPKPVEEPKKPTKAKPQPAPVQKSTETATSSKTKPKSKLKRTTKPKPTANTEPAPATTVRQKATIKSAAKTTAQPATKPAAKTPVKTPVKPKDTAAEPQDPQLQAELEEIETVSMSKAERRRLRKLAKRAAREKKAA